MKKFLIIILSVFCLITKGQKSYASEPVLRIVPLEDDVYVYHTQRLSAGHGFNIYRRGGPGEAFVRLNEKPVRGAQRIDDMRPMLADRYDDLLEMFEVESAASLWLVMRARHFEAGLASFLYPEAAKTMGRLYIDKDAPMNTEVTYRVEFVNNLDRPTGEELFKTLVLEYKQPKAPRILSAANLGSLVTLEWEYFRVKPEDDDFVIQFYIYRTDPQTRELQILNDRAVVRNNAYDNHVFTFESPVINTTEQYVVSAVDITGNLIEASEVFEYDLIYNLPLQPVYEISAHVTPEPWVEVAWKPSLEENIAGYRIYRSSDLSKPFVQITDELIPADSGFYLDTTVVGGLSYFYFVNVVGFAGNESEKGSVAMARVLDLFAPPQPFGLTAEFNTQTRNVELLWQTETLSENFETFTIMRRREDVANPGAFSRVNPDILAETTFIDLGGEEAGFLEGARYRYVVFSSSRAKIHSDTTAIVLTIPIITAPEAPLGVRAVNDNGFRIHLNWGAVSSRNLEKYTAYRKKEGEESFHKLLDLPITTRFIRDEDLQTGNTYIYAVTATDIAGNESEFSVPDTVFLRNYTPPASVRNIQAAMRDEGVELRWERVAADDFLGYKVYRSGIPTGIYEPLHEGLLEDTRFIDLTGNAEMWYRVRAVDTSGNESRPGSPVRPVITNQQ
ncbi:MAG: fibronectin type III domain-containing protein [Bacteroidales bacterium]